MTDFIDRFSFSDFAAYFFPGLFGLAAICTLLLGTEVQFTLVTILEKGAIVLGVAALGLAYALGAILAGVGSLLTQFLYQASPKWKLLSDPRDEIIPGEVRTEVLSAFSRSFPAGPSADKWCRCHFYLARTWVESRLPRIAALARRQNSLRVFRENLLMPSLLWITAGFVWSGRLHTKALCACLLVTSTVALLVVPLTLVRRARINRVREVREICLGLVVGAEGLTPRTGAAKGYGEQEIEGQDQAA